MMTLLTEARAALESVAERNPFPWTANWVDTDGDVSSITDANGDDVVIADSGVYPPRGATASFIASAPSLVRRLVEECERLSVLNAQYVDALNYLAYWKGRDRHQSNAEEIAAGNMVVAEDGDAIYPPRSKS